MPENLPGTFPTGRNGDTIMTRENSLIRWPFVAVATHNSEPLAEYRCSTPDSLIAFIRPYLDRPGVTITITVSEETRS